MSEKPLPSVAHYEPVATPSIPLDSAGNSLVNLYVYLPTPKKFVLFIPAGEKMTITRKIALERHVVPALFIRSTGEDSSPVVENKASESLLDHAVIGAEGASTLRSIFHKIMSPEIMEGDSKLAVEAFRGVADEMVSIIAPESADFKERLLENAQHLWVMNDAAAISTLAVIFAVANNFDSQKSLRDVIYASMVMDLPLVGFTPEVLSQFYVNPSSLPAETVEKIQDHPRQAFRVAKHALRFFSESALDLIFNHHELKNGAGYPRHVRTEPLAPLTRVFAAAVDAFDLMKKAEYENRSLTFNEVLEYLLEGDAEAHLRRHNRNIVERVVAFVSGQKSSHEFGAGENSDKKAA